MKINSMHKRTSMIFNRVALIIILTQNKPRRMTRPHLLVRLHFFKGKNKNISKDFAGKISV